MSHEMPVIGRRIERHGQVGSTNDLARARARADEPEGLVIIAEEQVIGRGRLGRGWAAPPGSSLLSSTLLRPTWLPPDAAFTLTMLAGVALCEATEQAAPPLRAALKWPNDLLLPASPMPAAPLRKAAGILSELVLVDGQITYVILGIGVNVTWSPTGIVDCRDLALSATSVSAAAGRLIERDALLAALLARLDTRYHELRLGRRAALFDAWRARLTTLGQHVTVATSGGPINGLAEDVTPDGALRLRGHDGIITTITAGDVSA